MKKQCRKIVVLGSTGSIGKSTLDVVRSLGGRVEVVGLSARTNLPELVRQAEEFMPEAVGIIDESLAQQLKSHLPGRKIFSGENALVDLATLADVDLVVVSVVGSAGIAPTLAAIEAGKDVALANKESLVAAGGIIVDAAASSGINLIPIDSEHSAVYQCLRGEQISTVSRIVLTASGGPLIDMEPAEIESVRVVDALRHPTWMMGRKVTIDSATLLNKGFEVIEAHWLFGLEADRIDVVVERNSIVHSLVEFIDGSVVALLSLPDMRLPIQFALTYPERIETHLPRMDLTEVGNLTFEKPDVGKFPCLQLAYDVARVGGTAPAVLSAADEIVVEAFLDGRIGFGQIHRILREVVDSHAVEAGTDLDNILKADAWAREAARTIMSKLS